MYYGWEEWLEIKEKYQSAERGRLESERSEAWFDSHNDQGQ